MAIRRIDIHLSCKRRISGIGVLYAPDLRGGNRHRSSWTAKSSGKAVDGSTEPAEVVAVHTRRG